MFVNSCQLSIQSSKVLILQSTSQYRRFPSYSGSSFLFLIFLVIFLSFFSVLEFVSLASSSMQEKEKWMVGWTDGHLKKLIINCTNLDRFLGGVSKSAFPFSLADVVLGWKQICFGLGIIVARLVLFRVNAVCILSLSRQSYPTTQQARAASIA